MSQVAQYSAGALHSRPNSPVGSWASVLMAWHSNCMVNPFIESAFTRFTSRSGFSGPGTIGAGCRTDGLFHFRQAHLEGLEDIHDRGPVLGSRNFHDFFAFDLGPDHGHQVFAVAVFVFFRLEGRFEGFDQVLRQLQFLVFYDAGIGAELLHLADLVVVIHRMQQDALAAGPQNYHVLAVVHGDAGHAHHAGLAQGFEQQGVGFFAGFVGSEVVRGFEINRVNLGGLHKLQNLHGPGGFGRDLFYFLVLNDHVFVFFVLLAV